jgi:hypothetical protein
LQTGPLEVSGETRAPESHFSGVLHTLRGFKIPVRWAAPVGCAGFDAGLEVHARAGYQIALGFATH